MVLLLASVVLLGAGMSLLSGTDAQFGRRDAFAEQVQNGARSLNVRRLAGEWRSEIAAQSRTAQRNRMTAFVLLATGVVTIATAISGRRSVGAALPTSGEGRA